MLLNAHAAAARRSFEMPFGLRMALLDPEEVQRDFWGSGVRTSVRTLVVLGELVPVANRYGTFFHIADVLSVIERHGRPYAPVAA